MLLALAICDVCPSSEVDVIISVLMNLYDTRTSLVKLLKFMIDREILHTGISCLVQLEYCKFNCFALQRAKLLYLGVIQQPLGFCQPSQKFTGTIT